MKVRRGDVVLVAFPFATGAGSKRRPALVVQSDHNNARLTNTVVAAITTTTHRSRERPQLLVDPNDSLGQGSGLLMTSVVGCENLAALEQSLITRVIGRLSPTAMSQIDKCLKTALGI
jgi:mRNA interferase MazF